jgi:hypothetical protein
MRLVTRKIDPDTVRFSWYVQMLNWASDRLRARADGIISRTFDKEAR